MCLKCFACLLFLTIVLIQAQDDTCPPNEDIFPCTCEKDSFGPRVTCYKLQGVDDLREVVAGLKDRRIFSLGVLNSHIGDLPGDVFKGAFITFIDFIDTNLTCIGDKENPPFTGLENSLQRLQIFGGFLDKNKPLTEPIQLGHLKKLWKITLDNNMIPEIGDDFFAYMPVSLDNLIINNCRVKKVGHSAFKKLKNLILLTFSGNSVSLERSAIAENPTSLKTINLSNNGLVDIPCDLFSNMPDLTRIYLNGNHFTLFPIDVRSPVLQQLTSVFIKSNPLECRRRIKEIVRKNLHRKIVGKCASPPKLAGRDIMSLTLEEMED